MGRVDYQVDMFDRRKRHRVFHINMLRKWHPPSAAAFSAKEINKGEEEVPEDRIPAWSDDEEEQMTQYEMEKGLNDTQQQELCTLLESFPEVLRNAPGKTSLIEHNIHVPESTPPVHQSPYRIPYAYRAMVQEELSSMLKAGIIEPSSSEWASPMVLVPKKDGSIRMCVDFRRLNSVTQVDPYPMPRVDELLDHIGKARYITTLDLTRGYWQVPVALSVRPLTAFITPSGVFQFRVMPFGLNGAPATFQRLMDRLLSGLEKFSAAYLDDVVIFSDSWKDHLEHL